MWILLQILACSIVTVVLMYQRKVGLCFNSIMAYIIASIVCLSWMFALSYEKAPNLLAPWFLGTVILSLGGFLGSVLYFGDTPTITQVIGAGLAIVASILLAL